MKIKSSSLHPNLNDYLDLAKNDPGQKPESHLLTPLALSRFAEMNKLPMGLLHGVKKYAAITTACVAGVAIPLGAVLGSLYYQYPDDMDYWVGWKGVGAVSAVSTTAAALRVRSPVGVRQISTIALIVLFGLAYLCGSGVKNHFTQAEQNAVTDKRILYADMVKDLKAAHHQVVDELKTLYENAKEDPKKLFSLLRVVRRLERGIPLVRDLLSNRLKLRECDSIDVLQGLIQYVGVIKESHPTLKTGASNNKYNTKVLIAASGKEISNSCLPEESREVLQYVKSHEFGIRHSIEKYTCALAAGLTTAIAVPAITSVATGGITGNVLASLGAVGLFAGRYVYKRVAAYYPDQNPDCEKKKEKVVRTVTKIYDGIAERLTKKSNQKDLQKIKRKLPLISDHLSKTLGVDPKPILKTLKKQVRDALKALEATK